MRKPDALARLVLNPGPAEQIEHPIMVARIDASAIVGNRHNCATVINAPAYADQARSSGQEVF